MAELADEPPPVSDPEAQKKYYRTIRRVFCKTHWKSVLGFSIISAVSSGYAHQTYPTSSDPTYSYLSSYASSLEDVAQSVAPTREQVLELAQQDDSVVALWNVPNGNDYFDIRKDITTFAEAYDPHVRSERIIIKTRFDAYAHDVRQIGEKDLAMAQPCYRVMSYFMGFFAVAGVVGTGTMLYNSRKKD